LQGFGWQWLALDKKEILLLPNSWSAIARCHLQKRHIVWDWDSLNMWKQGKKTMIHGIWGHIARASGWETATGGTVERRKVWHGSPEDFKQWEAQAIMDTVARAPFSLTRREVHHLSITAKVSVGMWLLESSVSTFQVHEVKTKRSELRSHKQHDFLNLLPPTLGLTTGWSVKALRLAECLNPSGTPSPVQN
jgi:hypothetical protein